MTGKSTLGDWHKNYHRVILKSMRKLPHIIVTGNVPAEWAGNLQEKAFLDIWNSSDQFLMPRKIVMEKIKDCDALLNFAELRVDEELLAEANRLKIVVNASIGFDNLDFKALKNRNIWACNSPGFFNFAVAEYIISCIMILSRRILEADRHVRQGHWTAFEPGRWDGWSLRDRKLGIVGRGAIGQELSDMASCMGMEVAYFDKYNNENPGFSKLDDLLATCDIISINVPLNEETYRMVDRSFIRKLKEGAILVNTSRGSIVDQDALIESLSAGELGGAVLDVFQDEPDVPEVLYSLSNVIITPHIAGGTKTSRRNCVGNAFLNIEKYFSGHRPPNALIEIDNDNRST
jgi:glyoxylate reductase